MTLAPVKRMLAISVPDDMTSHAAGMFRPELSLSIVSVLSAVTVDLAAISLLRPL